MFIFEFWRLGALPCYAGAGWRGEAYLNIPDEDALHLLTAENYAADREPSFTFRTDWIDFPAGPVSDAPDADFGTVGDFLNDYIYDVSDPTQLNAPFGNMLLRFDGVLAVRMEDDTTVRPGPPIWMEFGSIGFDGFRLRIFDPKFPSQGTVYRLPLVNPDSALFHENAIIDGVGMFLIEFTYFNKYDPDGEQGAERAGVEFYSWHGGGLALPAGEALVHPTRGPATLVPPWVIYEESDVLPLVAGDFDADTDVDLIDALWFQKCFTGPGDDGGVVLDSGCGNFDFDGDFDADLDDFALLRGEVTGAVACLESSGG